MRSSFFLTLLLVFFSGNILAQNSVGSWGCMLPFTPATSLAQADQRFFVGSEQSAMFSYDPSDNSLDTYTPTDGLSSIGIAALAYAPQQQTLVIAYANSKIDLWNNEHVTTVTDIQRSTIASDKSIHNITIKGDTAYLSCSFGVVVYDLARREVRDTYILGNNDNIEAVYSLAWSKDYVAVATQSGLKIAHADNANLADANQWQNINSLPDLPAREVVYWNDHFYVALSQESLNTDHLWRCDPISQSVQLVNSEPGWLIKDLSVGNNRLVVTQWQYQYADRRIRLYDSDTQYQDMTYWQLRFPYESLLDNQNVLWTVDQIGLHKILWAGNGEVFLPNAPFSSNLADLNVKNSELWVASGGVNSSFNYLFRPEGLFHWSDGEWNRYAGSTTFDMLDFITLAQHPSQNILYAGSYKDGLLAYDGTTFTKFRENNSTLGTAVDDEDNCRVSGLDFDQYNNLWIANWLSEKPIVLKQNNGEWRSFKPTISTERHFFDMEVDDIGQIWTIDFRNGIVVMNHNNTIDILEDDQYAIIKNGVGNGNLPASTVMCITKDKEGAIWAGTANGIGIFYCPYAVFTGGCEAELPYVEVGGYGANLFQNQIVRSIAVDGANRKWVGTENGLFLVSADGTSTLKSFTTSNSPLISNVIVSLAVDDATGRVYVGTERGLMYYQGDALGGGDSHTEVVVYPNPVLPDYQGSVMVKGLATNALVKITDITGNLLYEGTALGSQLIWDTKDAKGNKVSSGVYLVFSSNENMDDHVVAKIVVVN